LLQQLSLPLFEMQAESADAAALVVVADDVIEDDIQILELQLKLAKARIALKKKGLQKDSELCKKPRVSQDGDGGSVVSDCSGADGRAWTVAGTGELVSSCSAADALASTVADPGQLVSSCSAIDAGASTVASPGKLISSCSAADGVADPDQLKKLLEQGRKVKPATY